MKMRPRAYRLPADAQDVRHLEELVADIEAGFNRKDAAVLDGRFTADAILTVPDGTTLRGWDDLFAYHTARLAGVVRDWSTRISVLSVSPLSTDIAVVQVEQHTTTPERAFTNHGTIVAIKKERRWWISAMQNTTVV
ncbi:SgcJ/EcaC family oxidoreductase [Nonomuraea basaltis]|uniref:SgcJ/EcaC family oxidoreductase n=1 Tax=Nonomuraea basaltis TaxID=2495887 RepID=UPI00148615D5|nr:SgcJ/EcaC family oxidoreductase [Nonomuraea basaltis]